MGFLESLQNGAQQVKKDTLRKYEQQLSNASDEAVKRKLDTTIDEAYDITHREARRRGLL